MKPWTARDLTSLLLRVCVGLVMMGVAIYEAGGKATVAAQLPWASWAVGGLVVIGVANGLWLLSLRRALGRRYRLLFDRPALVTLDALRSGDEAGVLDRSALVAAPGMSRFHRATCLLAAGKAVRSSTRAVHQRAGRRPCGVCQP